MDTLLARLKPYDVRRGHVLRRYTYAGIRFQEERGWYRVEKPVADYLRTVHQLPGNLYSPLAFEVCTDDEAKALDAAQAAASKVRDSAFEELKLVKARPCGVVTTAALPEPHPAPADNSAEEDGPPVDSGVLPPPPRPAATPAGKPTRAPTLPQDARTTQEAPAPAPVQVAPPTPALALVDRGGEVDSPPAAGGPRRTRHRTRGRPAPLGQSRCLPLRTAALSVRWHHPRAWLHSGPAPPTCPGERHPEQHGRHQPA